MRGTFIRIASAIGALAFFSLSTVAVHAASLNDLQNFALQNRAMRLFAMYHIASPQRIALTPVASSSSSSRSSAATTSSSVSSSTSSVSSVTDDVSAILNSVNAERAKNNLGALTINPLLQQSAQNFATDMNNRGFFSHTDPEGRTPTDRISATGYLRPPCNCNWQYWVGENIAKGQTTAAQVMHDWMNSPEHRDNILSPNFAEIGIGRSGNVWVQDFGKVTHQ